MESDIILYPHEERAAVRAVGRAYKRFAGQTDSMNHLEELANMLRDEFAEVGLVISVNMDAMATDPKTHELVRSPEVIIEGRIEEEILHDHEKHARELEGGS